MALSLDYPEGVLPLPTFEGYAVQPMDATLRTDMESGPARQRLEFTDVPERITVRWDFTEWEYAVFRGWYRYKAQRGAAFFNMKLLNGLGMVNHEVRFVGQGRTPYQAAPRRGTRWSVTATLEVRKSEDLTEEALDLALSEDITGLLAAIDAWHVSVQTTVPATHSA